MEDTNRKLETVIPILAEDLEVGTRQIATGSGVRIYKTVTEREQIVDQPLFSETSQVTRVPVNRAVDSALPIRHEGDLVIIPVLEEQLIVEKRLILKEEIHIRKISETTRQPRTVVLREEHVEVERFGEQPETTEPPARPPASGSILDRVFAPGGRNV